MSTFEFSTGATAGGRTPVRRISDGRPREKFVVSGVITATDLARMASGSAFRCTLDDGSGQLDLLFVGRTAIAGLSVDVRCSAEGTASVDAGRLVMWNPLYRLGDPASAIEVVPSPPLEPALGRRVVASATDVDLDSGVDLEAEIDLEPEVDFESSPAFLPGTGDAPLAGDSRETKDLVEAAGHFRVYLGAAPGVGKTVAMLDEAQRRRRRGADIVIGLVESHGRPVTRSLTTGLEVVPRRHVDYRGTSLFEMDLDAVLERRPKVVLVDELAHTNVPGSGRHEKRWQDVVALLEAGIDVITTVNIQHLESIADAVERITGAKVRERVPDWVVRRADQIELVDSSPEQLRRRMLHGNIYPPERVPQALGKFFRADNLTALRELALRFVADETEEELLEFLRRSHSDVLWETSERIMVGVTASSGSDAVVRRASRIAARLKAELHVVHVKGGDTAVRRGAERLQKLRQVAIDVGATWHEIDGDDPVEALIDFARREQITQLVIGSSQRSRWQQLTGGGSVVRRLSHRAAEAGLDMHIIARMDENT